MIDLYYIRGLIIEAHKIQKTVLPIER
jgi:hypothetical protein